MLRSIQKLIGDKRKQLIFPIFLMSLDAIGSLVMYLMLYFTVIHLLNGSLTGGLVRNYTIVCLISIILRLIIYRSGYFLCFSRGAEMCSGLRLDLANHYRSLSLGYFNQNSSGYLLSTLTKDLSNFELVLTHTLPSIVKTLVMGCLILVGTFFINWKLALAECVVILIALPVLNWGNRLVEKYGTIKRDLTSKMISIVLEYIKGMKVFKSANMTSTHFTRMSDTLEDIRKTSVQAEVKTAAPTSMYSIIANFLLPFVLLVGSYLFLGGTIASELLVAFMLMSLALSALLIAFEHSYNLLKELKLATSNLEQAFDTKPLSYKEEKVKLSHFDITFENVNFSYNQQADVLHNISFHAPEGSTTALIGPSGSGKSTVANLIARFWDVTKGCVRIGGQDIRELNPDGLLHYISEVFQENTLLSDTIYNNIKAGREDATEQEVIAAAKTAHCHEFIERLPNGYQTHLAEGGNTLSGGEKQRIAIARAILKDAPILLLDESTASLDADNEAKINQALDRLMKGKTVFVIAHRLNTIQNADQIKPHWKSLFGSVFSKMGNVLSRALRIIICISVIFWLLSYSADGNVANSIIYKVGTFIEPVTSLFGLPWQLFIAFVASAMGKEASLGVMASLFNTGSIWAAIEQSATVDTAALSTSMLSVISRPEALAFLFAFFFNMPCLMALTATTQETHSMKWTVRIALYYVLTALIMATIAYHVGLVIF